MRPLLISTVVFMVGSSLLIPQFATANPGMRGGIPTIAAPSGGGGRIPGIGGGGVGIHLGGGRRGGIRFGVGGADNRVGIGGERHGGGISPSIRGARRSRQMIEENHDNMRDPDDRERWHPWRTVQPELQPIQPNPRPIPRNGIPIQPNPHPVMPERQPVQPISPIQTNELPAAALQKNVSSDLQKNPLVVSGRRITEEEVERAIEFFHVRLAALAKNLESKLPATKYDREQLAQLMAAKKVPAKTQVQIVDALDGGDHKKAQRLWISALPCCWVPFGPNPARDLLVNIRLAIEQGRLSSDDVQELAGTLRYDTVRTDGPTNETCCGADDLVYQLEQEVRINMAISGIRFGNSGHFGKPNGYGKPEHNARPPEHWIPNHGGDPDQPSTSSPSGKPNDHHGPVQHSASDFHGKPNGYGKLNRHGIPGQSVSLPTGLVNIISHPKLPQQSVVVVDSQTVMVGTGGEGVFQMEQGYVAEALGHRIASGPPMPDSHSIPVRSGILIVNPTHSKVNFRIGTHGRSLDPGSQHILNTSTPEIISFDRGNGKKNVRYQLSPGAYRFKIDQEGWNLMKRSYKVVISNRGNIKPFNYFVQGERATVEAESTTTHSSNYPIDIRFDRGNGSEAKQVRHEKMNGTLQVAINPSDNLWDLVDAPSDESPIRSIVKKNTKFVPAF